ncbi:twin-arginine translocation signal domain-containing protein [Spiribacter aquaticus]|uniref:Twin-arginine translocation signal domain-containing protein n=1 Tax=Spiribacter aquaticus TaxID=1935996 RepID=A0A557RFJ2_9GAMM|nr:MULTISPECIES: twin-arginine translocation signal domain-containing protein [Spiribacter]KAF0280485.1 ABC transporter substrate-binding protein [Spiribacter roseus]TVO63916.1 twin-arginine translocation signal domain-containing protein [Spiribacter aquaticus]
MDRRGFIKGAGTGLVAAGSINAPAVIAQPRRFRLNMLTSWPASLDNLYGTAEYFAERIEVLTDGDVRVRTSPGGAEVGPVEVYDAVSSGAFEACHTAPYYFIGKNPAHGFFTSLPFGMTLEQQNAWMTAGDGQTLWDELNAQDNLIAFPGGNTSAQCGGWFNVRINSPADLQGLRMRFPGHGGRAMAKAGVNIQQLPGGEVFTAMERGALDAAEWVGPYDDQILGMQDVAQYYYLPSWAEPSAMLGFYFNLDVWSGFPADIQAQIRACCAEANNWMAAQYLAKNPVALESLKSQGVEVLDFPDSVLAAFRNGAAAVHEEDMDNEDYARIYPNWSAFRDRLRGWDQVNSYRYREFIYRDAD